MKTERVLLFVVTAAVVVLLRNAQPWPIVLVVMLWHFVDSWMMHAKLQEETVAATGLVLEAASRTAHDAVRDAVANEFLIGDPSKGNVDAIRRYLAILGPVSNRLNVVLGQVYDEQALRLRRMKENMDAREAKSVQRGLEEQDRASKVLTDEEENEPGLVELNDE